MLDNRELPSVSEIRFYLDREGWDEHPPGPAGSLWTKDTTTLAVPTVEDPAVKSPLIDQLAALSSRHYSEICHDIKYYAIDMADFRAANDLIDFDSIPLSAAETIIANILSLLRSCGTTAFDNKGDLKGHYSRIGDQVMRNARMAHTKQGSFIIPVLVRLPLEDMQTAQDDQLITTSLPEPVERRVLRTLAQSLHAINETIVQPAVEPSLERLHAAVEMGVSREMCVALRKVLEEPIVGELDTTFRWAPAVEPSKTQTSGS